MDTYVISGLQDGYEFGNRCLAASPKDAMLGTVLQHMNGLYAREISKLPESATSFSAERLTIRAEKLH